MIITTIWGNTFSLNDAGERPVGINDIEWAQYQTDLYIKRNGLSADKMNDTVFEQQMKIIDQQRALGYVQPEVLNPYAGLSSLNLNADLSSISNFNSLVTGKLIAPELTNDGREAPAGPTTLVGKALHWLSDDQASEIAKYVVGTAMVVGVGLAVAPLILGGAATVAGSGAAVSGVGAGVGAGVAAPVITGGAALAGATGVLGGAGAILGDVKEVAKVVDMGLNPPPKELGMFGGMDSGTMTLVGVGVVLMLFLFKK